MANLFTRLRTAISADPKTIWFDVVGEAGVAFAEEVFGFPLPKILRQSYLEISNGGFGPGPIIGLPGGYQSSFGDLIETWEEFQRDEDFEDGWLPIIDWGCTDFSFIDCENDFQMVTRYEGDYHLEEYSFESLLKHWLDGQIPERNTGNFFRPGS